MLPFPLGKTPSFTVNPEKGFFHCFGCGAGGDVFTFVMKRDHVSFVEAERILANKYGIPIPEPEKTAEEIRREQEEKEIVGTNELAARFFHACLTKTQYGKEGLTYLASRGIGMDIVESFELGLAPPDAQTFHKALEKRGIPEKTLLKAGLIGQSDSGRIYDKFRERIMIPIKNPRGKVVGFTGRILRKEASPAKYMNTPETSWFHKGRLLFGMDRALPSIRKRRQALIVEGHMDAISLHAAGITWAVASMGTAFTEYQAKLLKRVTPEVIFCFDSDNAGRNAAMRSIPIALAVGLECRVMHVTDGKDPDEFIRKDGQEAFLSLLDQAKGGIDYEVDTVLSRSDVTTLSGKVGAVSEILPFSRTAALMWKWVNVSAIFQGALSLMRVKSGVSTKSLSAPMGADAPSIPNGCCKRRLQSKARPNRLSGACSMHFSWAWKSILIRQVLLIRMRFQPLQDGPSLPLIVLAREPALFMMDGTFLRM